MSKINQNKFLIFLFVLLPILSLFTGFILNEDLSTGGSKWDFELTWPVIKDYSNLNLFDAQQLGGKEPRHFPFHYLILASIYNILNDQYLVRLFYLIFSLLMPIFLYLNLIKIYDFKKINILIVSFSFLFFPYFRSSAIWSNAHLTALIFFLISNYYFLKVLSKNKLKDKLLNLLFLAFATYTMQTYVILFSFYLFNYFTREKIKIFFGLLLFCCILGIPPLSFLLFNERMLNLPITQDYFYTITNNFSIILFFLLFLMANKLNLIICYNKLKSLKIIEITLILLFFLAIVYNLNYDLLNSNLRGGGFFYKISHFILKNNFIFILSFLMATLLIYLTTKQEKNLIFIILLINIMGLNYQIYQKYFEPLLLVMIFVLFKNIFVSNIFLKLKNVFFFYALVIFYFLLAFVNLYYGFSKNMTI